MKFAPIPPKYAQFGFWGLCTVMFAWIILAIMIETSLGWPQTTGAVLTRCCGWIMSFLVLRAFFLGMRRCMAVRA